MFGRPRAGFGPIPLLAAAAIAGCACPRCPPVSPSRPADALGDSSARAYAALQEQLHGSDHSPLHGRRIVIDPGHGGRFRGAQGPGGLAEADVNLGVALHLRTLLARAGAQALLTRETDRDFLDSADSSLSRDLDARLALIDSFRPDVFVSIHHNSNAALDTTLNAIETYYPAGRDGVDLDLARAIHRHLARNLRIAPARVLPGNFRVLRECSVPAVLGEASMISNPAMERILARDEKQELEAQAYFLGLLDFFAGGMPHWQLAQDIGARHAPAVATWRFVPGDGDQPVPGLDASSVALTLDGRPEPCAVSAGGDAVRWPRPRILPAGPHELVLRGRNLAGRATVAGRLAWLEEPRLHSLRAELWIYASGEADARLDSTRQGHLLIEACDQTGRPLPVGEAELTDASVTPARTLIRPLPTCPDGRVWLRVRPGDLPREVHLCRREAEDVWECYNLTWTPHRLPSDLALLPMRLPSACPEPGRPTGHAWRDRLSLPPRWNDVVPPQLRDATRPLLGQPVGEPFWIEADGLHPLVGDERHRGPWAQPDAAPRDTLAWRPLLPALLGRTVLLDPAGGGADFDRTGPSGTRGSDLNVAVARALAALLRGAGVRVALTREDDRWVAPEAKLMQANETRADLLLTLRRARPGEADWTARHAPGSESGRRWACLLARAAAPLVAPDSLRCAPSAAYLLRQAACPALEAGLPPPRDAISEQRLEQPSHQAATARALFLAIAALLEGEEALSSALDPAQLIASAGAVFPPLDEVEWAQLDGNLPWLPSRWSDGPGASPSSGAAPGLPALGAQHTLEVRTADDWRLVALRREGGGFAARIVHHGDRAHRDNTIETR